MSRFYWQSETRKELKRHHFDLRVRSREKMMLAPVKTFLREQASRVIDQMLRFPSPTAMAGMQFSIRDEAQRFHDALSKYYWKIADLGFHAGIAASKGELESGKATPGYVKPKVVTPANEAALRKMIVYSGTKQAETTMNEVHDALRIAEEEMWTVEGVTQYVAAKLGQETIWKARRIARTETAKTENWAELEGYKDTEFVEYKGWICAYVELSREAHKIADQEYGSNPIPLDDDFVVMGEPLDHPGDPQGSPENIINCLCTMFPAIKNL
jgi:hypothetical protein